MSDHPNDQKRSNDNHPNEGSSSSHLDGNRPRGDLILMIGATGYVGERMRARFKQSGHRVRLMVRKSSEQSVFEDQGFETVVGDVLDPASLIKSMQDVDTVINLVAIIKERGENVTFEKINYQGSVNVIDAARQAGVKRFIQMSAIGAGNRPAMPYLHTKWRAENYLKESGLDWTIIRPSLMFGATSEGHEHFVSQLADIVRTAPVIPVVGGGDARFQPIHLDDVSDSFLRVAEDREAIHQTYEIGGPDVLTYRDMLEEIASVMGSRKPKVPVPTMLISIGAAILEKLPVIESPVTRDQLKMLEIDNVPEENSTPALIGRSPKPFHGNVDYIKS